METVRRCLLILSCARIAIMEENMPKTFIRASTDTSVDISIEDPVNQDTKFWVALSRVPHLGTVHFRC